MKDLIDVAGTPTTAASRVREGHVGEVALGCQVAHAQQWLLDAVARVQSRMIDSLKRRVRRFTAERSGTRFRAHYQRLAQRPNLMRTLLLIGLGLMLLALGMIMLVTPGPGLLIAAIGAALIAGESKWAATLLDRVDLCVTRLWRRWRAR